MRSEKGQSQTIKTSWIIHTHTHTRTHTRTHTHTHTHTIHSVQRTFSRSSNVNICSSYMLLLFLLLVDAIRTPVKAAETVETDD